MDDREYDSTYISEMPARVHIIAGSSRELGVGTKQHDASRAAEGTSDKHS